MDISKKSHFCSTWDFYFMWSVRFYSALKSQMKGKYKIQKLKYVIKLGTGFLKY